MRSGFRSRLIQYLAISTLIGAMVALAAAPVVAVTGAVLRNAITEFQNLPAALTTPPLPERTRIVASDGTLVGSIFDENRVEVPLQAVSPLMQQAMIAIEDSRFFLHNGFDLRGLIRAFFANAAAGEVVQGGSTITQQLVENTLLQVATTPEEVKAARAQSVLGKIQEIQYALQLERTLSKQQILERYLNVSYFGAGAYGIESAARRYFSKSATELNANESAIIAGIVQSPSANDPLAYPDRNEARRNVVLDRMVDLGFLSRDDANTYKDLSVADSLDPSPLANGCVSSYAPYFCDYVLTEIRNNPAYGATLDDREAFLRQTGLTIETTLRPDVQRSAQSAVDTTIPRDDESKKAISIVMVEPATGGIIAMAQNRLWGTEGDGYTTYNYGVGRANNGTVGMQAGSTFKAYTLAAAFKQGISPSLVINARNPKTFNFVDCLSGEPMEPYIVRNSTRSGRFTMAQATAYSVNTYFVKLAQQVTPCAIGDIAEDMGVRTGSGDLVERVPSLTLGVINVTPLTMASSYGVFANKGIYCPPTAINKITDRTGKILSVPAARCSQAMEPAVADGVTDMLTRVIDGAIEGRTGARMSLGRPAAGKTGTTNENSSVWFVGYTPDVSAAVWVGDPRGGFKYPLQDITINGKYYRQVYGSTMAGPIWKTAMETAHQNIPRRGFKLKPNYDPAEVLLFPGAGSVIDGESTIEDELPEGID
jgi:membrane peptidoglycan carboxypeptidase